MSIQTTLSWRTMDTYNKGDKVLFWVASGCEEFPVYGYINIDGEIWDENGAGFGSGNKARLWAKFSPPDLNLH
ncbi:hypothetical protein [Pseudovibrio sp. Ad26]|uniref:hypothetical protein n=1 Tax=Pseudovibrio sp. Ad26 TaxID=989410 RepID=UPI0007B27A5D|nr:hypothetical protein [Pseudovibrio sp. Ad26]KZL11710.1 hypothetical protein PsAD26_02567 [Pseudovibrio sp. Ad26]